MTDSKIYFGRPGSLVELRHPRGGLRSTRVLSVGSMALGDGGRAVDRRVTGARRYELSYESLTLADFQTLEGYAHGHNGPGPFALLDPGQRNMLTVNQSSATSHLGDTSNFTLSGSGWTMATETSIVHRGPNSLKLDATFDGQGFTLRLDPAWAGWPGIPVYPRAYTFSFWTRLAGDTSVVLTLNQAWLDSSGATLSTEADNQTVSGSGSWVQVSGTGTAPAGAAYCNLTVAGSGASMSASTIIYMDQFQYEEGSTAGDWSPGTGVLPIAVESLEDQWTWQWPDYRSGPAIVLLEDTS